MSFHSFMRNLLLDSTASSLENEDARHSKNIAVVSDNAKVPCHLLLTIQRLPRQSPVFSSNGIPYGKRPHIYRYHSEPIVRDQQPMEAEQERSTSRWTAGKTDSLLVAPQRNRDRWCVSRNHSDSSLLLPLRSNGGTRSRSRSRNTAPEKASKCVLFSLPRKYSASMQASTKLIQMHQEIQVILEEDSDPEVPVLEARIPEVVPIENNTDRQRESNARFLRSILAKAETLFEEDQGQEQGEQSKPKSAIRILWDLLYAMFGLFCLVLKVISTELIGPAVLKPANQFLNTLIAAFPGADDSHGYHIILPLFGTKHQHQAYDNEFAPSSTRTSTKNVIVPRGILVHPPRGSWERQSHRSQKSSTVII